MKISTALALGRTLIRPIRGVHLNSTHTGGCAWGMINVAAPDEYGEMNQRAGMPIELPCECTDDYVMGSGGSHALRCHINRLSSVIVHLFNYHVMTANDWTMEQLIDWIASVEPKEKADDGEVLESAERNLELSAVR